MHTRTLFIALLLGAWTCSASAVDKDDAQRILRTYKCFSCHSVTRQKEGPSYQEVAQKYASHPNPRVKLYEHLTTSPTIDIDGAEEQHKSIDVKDKARIENLVEWILSHK